MHDCKLSWILTCVLQQAVMLSKANLSFQIHPTFDIVQESYLNKLNQVNRKNTSRLS